MVTQARTLVEIVRGRLNPGSFDESTIQSFQGLPHVVDSLSAIDQRIEDGPNRQRAVRDFEAVAGLLTSYANENVAPYSKLIDGLFEARVVDGTTVKFPFRAMHPEAKKFRDNLLKIGYNDTDIADFAVFEHTRVQDGEMFRNFEDGLTLLPFATEIGRSKTKFITDLKAKVLDGSYVQFREDIYRTHSRQKKSALPEDLQFKDELEKAGLGQHASDFGVSPNTIASPRWDILRLYQEISGKTGLSYEKLRPIVVCEGNIYGEYARKMIVGLSFYVPKMNVDLVVENAIDFATCEPRAVNFPERMGLYAWSANELSSAMADRLFLHFSGTPPSQTKEDLKAIDNVPEARDAFIGYLKTQCFGDTPNQYKIAGRGLHSEHVIGSIAFISRLVREGYRGFSPQTIETTLEGTLPNSHVRFETLATAYLGLHKQ